MRIRLALAASLITVGTLAIATSAPAAARSDSGPRHAAVGVVRLDGDEEPHVADPDGRGHFGYAAFGHTLCYILTARNIEPATLAHIHIGPPDVAGPIVVGLEAPTDGLSFDCITAVAESTDGMALLQSELDDIIANTSDYYVNVHNAPFPAGAIRAQLR